MGGGRLREVAAHGGSTVCLLKENSRSSLEVVCSSICLQMHIVSFNVVLNLKFIFLFFNHFDVCEW